MVDTLLNNEGISLHNQLRALHGCPPLVYDSSLARSAQLWAEQLAMTKCMRHSERETYGENLAYKITVNNDVLSAEEATHMWYDQMNMHDFESEFTYETGYFTQLVWKATKLIGLGRAVSADGTVAYVVAHYAPKGNIRNLFAVNVPRARPGSSMIYDSMDTRTSIITTREETKQDRKDREKLEKKERERQEKERKEREKLMKKELKEREKMDKKEKRKSLKGL